MKAEDISLHKAISFELLLTDDILVLFLLIAKFYNEYSHAKIVSFIKVTLILKHAYGPKWSVLKNDVFPPGEVAAAAPWLLQELMSLKTFRNILLHYVRTGKASFTWWQLQVCYV